MRFCAILSFIVILFVPALLFASTDRFNIISNYPSLDRSGYFFIMSSDQLKKGEALFGTMATYGYQPLRVTRGGVHVRDGIEQLLVSHIYSAYGIADRWQIGLDLPIVPYYKYGDVDTILSDVKGHANIGDMHLDTKFRLLNRSKRGIGLSINTWLSVPTGRSSHFLGDEKPTGALILSIDKNVGNRLKTTFNLGGIFRDGVSTNNIEFDNQMKIAGGVEAKIFRKFWALLEVDVRTPFKKMFSDSNSTPAELRAGLSWQMEKGLKLKTGGSWGISSGSAIPEFGVFAGLNYTAKIEKKKLFMSENIQNRDSEENAIIVTIYFRFDRYYISAKERPSLLTAIDKLKSAKKIIVEGHADLWGDSRYNDELSKRRALYTKKHLVEYGIDESIIEVKYYGSTKPISIDMVVKRQARNRRAEIKAEFN